MFKNIGLKFAEDRTNSRLYKILDKELFKDCLYELSEVDSYYYLIYKNLYCYKSPALEYILIEDIHINILIKYCRIKKLKIVENVLVYLI